MRNGKGKKVKEVRAFLSRKLRAQAIASSHPFPNQKFVIMILSLNAFLIRLLPPSCIFMFLLVLFCVERKLFLCRVNIIVPLCSFIVLSSLLHFLILFIMATLKLNSLTRLLTKKMDPLFARPKRD